MNPRKQWFIDHIGKTIHRTKRHCRCRSCNESYENGVYVAHEEHALYLYGIEKESGTRYFETKEERDEFEAQNKFAECLAVG